MRARRSPRDRGAAGPGCEAISYKEGIAHMERRGGNFPALGFPFALGKAVLVSQKYSSPLPPGQ